MGKVIEFPKPKKIITSTEDAIDYFTMIYKNSGLNEKQTEHAIEMLRPSIKKVVEIELPTPESFIFTDEQSQFVNELEASFRNNDFDVLLDIAKLIVLLVVGCNGRS